MIPRTITSLESVCQPRCFEYVFIHIIRLLWENVVEVVGHTVLQLCPIQHAELGDGPDVALNGGTLLVSSTYLRKEIKNG